MNRNCNRNLALGRLNAIYYFEQNEKTVTTQYTPVIMNTTITHIHPKVRETLEQFIIQT